MRMGEKLQDLRKLIVNALILLLLGTGLFWAGTLVSNSGQTTTISQEEVYARLQEINELCTMNISTARSENLTTACRSTDGTYRSHRSTSC